MVSTGSVTIDVHADASPALRSLRKVRHEALLTAAVVRYPLVILAALVLSSAGLGFSLAALLL